MASVCGSQLLLHVHRDIIKAIPFLQSPDSVFVARIVRLLTPLQFLPGEVVYTRGEIGLGMFFITHGEARMETYESPSLANAQGAASGEKPSHKKVGVWGALASRLGARLIALLVCVVCVS